MITYDPATNIGFDFDVNLEVNDNEEQYLAKEIRQTLERAFQKVYGKYGYTHFENSKWVFTIKLYDSQKKKIIHSCDIAIVNNFIDEAGTAGQEYIAFDKKSNSYSWQQQSKSFNLKEKENWLRQQPKAWNAVRERYLKKKNQNQNIHKHSRSLYTETINEICKQYGFDDQLWLHAKIVNMTVLSILLRSAKSLKQAQQWRLLRIMNDRDMLAIWSFRMSIQGKKWLH